MTEQAITDWRGTPIEIGSRVTWTGTYHQGRAGRVTKVNRTGSPWQPATVNVAPEDSGGHANGLHARAVTVVDRLPGEATEPYVFDILTALTDGQPLNFHGNTVPDDVQAWCAEHLTPVPAE